MTEQAIFPTASNAPTLEQLMAWPAAWASFMWQFQIEYLRQLTDPTGAMVPPWMRWHNGTEQLA